MGCPVFVSDLAVHREQCPKALGYFPTHDAGALADLIAAAAGRIYPRDPTFETRTRSRSPRNWNPPFATYGRQLEEICAELAVTDAAQNYGRHALV